MKKHLVLSGLFTAPFFYLVSGCSPVESLPPQEAVIEMTDGRTCKGAWVGKNSNNFITASHCIPFDSKVTIKTRNRDDVTLGDGNFNLLTSFSYKGFVEPDIAILDHKDLNIGNCPTNGTTLYGKSCDLKEFEHGYISTKCHFDRGESGTILFDEKNNPCVVYSGFYDIISKNKNIKIGVFKPLRTQNE